VSRERTPGILAGIFVGGAGSRMGGVAKGLLKAPDGATVVERWRDTLAGMGLEVVLVGRADAYAHIGLEVVADRPPGIGPLGGIVGLLERAESAGCVHAIAVACDMPFVSSRLIERLLCAPAEAAIVAPRREGRWEPLCARYDAARVLPAARARSRREASGGGHSLARLLDDAGALSLPLSSGEALELRDWDTPEDVET
jgi:molybdopterin-guanine dinucleotide biosynthesis protein A